MKKHILIYPVLLFLIYSCSEEPSQRKIIQSESAPAAIGPYSQAIMVGNTLYAAGQIGLVPGTGEMAGEDLETQARQALNNLKAVLEEAGFTMQEVVSVDVYLSDLDDYSSFNEI
ncbi:MAG: Rid family detoxifying hydrolase, partial [Balneolaceae bacterium]|nr:Rid family detoxifying hydrolase [Balneolaceae bacterium]